MRDQQRLPREMKDLIRDVKDFPKTGVVFKDIFPLLQECFGEVIDDLSRKIERPHEIHHIVGIESRGFIFAAALAYKLNKGLIPIRKKGKLPPPVISERVTLEYGEAELEMSEYTYEDISNPRNKCVIVDDIMATGGTMEGAWRLALKCGYQPKQALVLINIKSLNALKPSLPLKSLFEYRADE